jgi:leader peptidase (prepilin peptidase)/N-methyltransferase
MLGDGIDWCLLAAEIRQPPLPLWALELIAKSLLAAWLFFFGACVGSFLNVVVYRLPRGLNLVYPGSRCPQCGHAIRARDNLPIFGWLLLRGRCRDCQSPISSQYYFVELFVGLLFLVVAVLEAFWPRGTLAESEGGRGWLIMSHGAAFWAMYATHVSLAVTLVAATLIEFDSGRVPRRLFVPILLVGLGLSMLWPSLRPEPFALGLFWPDWLAGLADGLAGIVAGAVLGALVACGWWLGNGQRSWHEAAPITLLAAVGCVLGWQRTIELAPPALLVYAIGVAATSRVETIFPLAAPLFALALPLVLPLGIHYFRAADLTRNYDPLVVIAAALAVAASAYVAGSLARPQYFAHPPEFAPPTPAPEPVAAPPEQVSETFPLPPA